MFYDHFVTLCQSRGISPSRAALDAGLSKSTVTKWKQDPTAMPTGNVIEKLTQYFGISISDLLGDANAAPPCPNPAPAVLTGEPVSFYEHYLALCRSRGVTPSRAAVDAGISKSLVSKWKTDPDAQPTGAIISRLTAYFAVPVSELLGEPEAAPRPVTDEDIKFALFGGSEDITPEMFEEVRSFAAFVKNREAAKKNTQG